MKELKQTGCKYAILQCWLRQVSEVNLKFKKTNE
jgi:hypothetical protein